MLISLVLGVFRAAAWIGSCLTRPWTAFVTDVINRTAVSRPFDEDPTRTAGKIALAAGVGGFVFNAAKCTLFPDWLPNLDAQRLLEFYIPSFGLRFSGMLVVLILFACMNLVAAAAAVMGLCVQRNPYLSYAFFGLFLALPGWFESAMFRASIIAIAWHGAIGFFAGLTLAVNRFSNHIERRWSQIDPALDVKTLVDLRKEMLKELQWSVSTLAQVFAAFSAILGVTMTILYRTSPQNTRDLSATAIQMILGYAVCLFLVYVWGISSSLEVMATARDNWLTTSKVAADRATDS